VNRQDDKYLAEAKENIARGDEFHLMAGRALAKLAERGWSYKALAREVGKSDWWVRQVVANATKARPDSRIAWDRGSHGTREEFERTVAERPERVTEAIQAAPAATRRKIIEGLSEDVADAVEESPDLRLRTDAASSRAKRGVRGQVRSEQRARESEVSRVVELGAALVRVKDAARDAARLWAEIASTLDGEAEELAQYDIGRTQAEVAEIFDAMTGEGLDEALAQILGEGA